MKNEMTKQTVVPDSEIFQFAKSFFKEIFKKEKLDDQQSLYREEYINVIAYFCLYGYIPIQVPDNSNDTQKINAALIAISSTPWMGAASERYLSVLESLIGLKILKFKKYKTIECVLILNTNTTRYSKAVTDDLCKIKSKIKNCYKNRIALHQDLGWTITAQDIKQEVQRILESAGIDEEITLKLVTYHGRTWFGVDNSGNFIKDMLVKYLNLRVKILIVDKNACISIRECYNSIDCVNSSSNGVTSIINMPYKYRKRIQIRYYGKKVEEGFLRGIIIHRNNKTVLTRIINWCFSFERTLYGRVIELHPQSSLALLCNTYFDSVFGKARPAGKPFDIFIYAIRLYTFKFLYAIIPAIFVWSTFIMYWKNVDVLYPTLVSIGFAVWGFLGTFLNKKERQ